MANIKDLPELAVPQREISAEKRAKLLASIEHQLNAQNAVLIAHYYADPAIQALAESTGGCVADSLEMARFGANSSKDTLVIAGVYFMGETAKILSPNKKVIMPDYAATCSLDLGCPADELIKFKQKHPNHTLVVYANTSARVKAITDWVVTSSIAVDVVLYLHQQGKSIIFAPDKHLGHYIAKQTGADMLIWDSACIVHESFKENSLKSLQAMHPDAAILVHPESPAAVISLADVVGSTSQLIAAAASLPQKKLIVATELGIFYKMQQAAPNKELIAAPTGGHGATCQSCAYCPWMAMNTLAALDAALSDSTNSGIEIAPEVITAASISLDRMLNFKIY